MKGETDLKNAIALLLGIPFTLTSTIMSATALSFRQDRWRRVEMSDALPH